MLVGLPFKNALTLSIAKVARRCLPSTAVQLIWGVIKQFLAASSGLSSLIGSFLTASRPAAYILRRRMHKAKKLLKVTDLPISEIANNVGFSDYNYFSRVYKKTYGKSPKYYRR